MDRPASVERLVVAGGVNGQGAEEFAVLGHDATASYQYDAADNLQQIVEPAGGGTVLMTYDTAGRKTQLSDPDTGTTTYAYDPDGNLYKSIDARGAAGTTWTGYDNLDRPIWRNSQNSPTNPTADFVYDTGTNGQGRLAHEDFTGAPANNLSGSYDYTYDARGRLASSTLTLPGLTPYVMSATYDDADHVLSQGYPDQETVQPGYSATGWLTSLATTPSGGSSITLLNAATYGFAPTASPPQFGGPAQLLTAAGLGGGSFQYSATYDAQLRPTDLKLTNGTGSTTYFEQARSFDGAGNVTSANTTLPAGTDNQAFCYEEQNRLTWAQANNETSPCTGMAGTPGTLSSAQYRQGFGYDTLGRLTSIGLLFNSWHYVYGDLAHPHGVTSIYYNLRGSPITIYSGSYDPAGNMICRDPSSTNCSGGTNTGAQLSYSTTGRLVGWQNTATNPTATAGFLYDAEGNRVEQQITQSGSTTTIVYVGNLEQDTINGSTTTKTTFYYAGGRRIATASNLAATPPGPISYLASDGLGSADVAVRASDSSTTSVLYAPYGAVRYSSGTMPTDYGFTGQHADSTSGLDYYNARYYDPTVGQFTSADSILPGNGFDVFGLSRYAYVEGNPVVRTDPSGHGDQYPSGNPEAPAYGPALPFLDQNYHGSDAMWHYGFEIRSSAGRFGVEPWIVAVIVAQESSDIRYRTIGGRQLLSFEGETLIGLFGDAGLGIGHVHFKTARGLQDAGFMPVASVKDTVSLLEYEPTNIEYVAAYLARLKQQLEAKGWTVTPDDLIAAYNLGYDYITRYPNGPIGARYRKSVDRFKQAAQEYFAPRDPAKGPR